MEKEVKCTWCGETVVPTVSTEKNNFGKIKVRKFSMSKPRGVHNLYRFSLPIGREPSWRRLKGTRLPSK